MFESLMQAALPELTVVADAPLAADGEWWFDVEGENGFRTTVSWSPRWGFGIFLGEAGYGERPDEIYRTAELAVLRVRMLLAATREGDGARPMSVGQVRRILGVTQVDLASALALTQANISRLEGRSNLTLGSLRSMIEALGGTMELRARFPDLDVPIALPEREA